MTIALFSPITGVPAVYDVRMHTALNGKGPGGGVSLSTNADTDNATTAGYGNPVDYQRIDHSAAEVWAFGRDWYDRIHINPTFIDLGNVIGEQERQVRIWNAYRRVQNMAQLDTSGTDGLLLTGQPTPPLTWEPLQERVYTLTVGTTGPAAINASYTWNFEPYDVTLEIVGSRVTPWTFAPDWTNRILERLEFRTDVIQHFDGSEQRRSVRLAPRKRFEFDAFFTGRERRYAENVIWGWGARNWALPIWTDGQDLPAELPAGATAIPIDTNTRDFTEGGFAILLGDAFTYEIVEVSGVFADQILISRPTNETWPQGTPIYPARLARLNDRVSLPRWDGQASHMRAQFDIEGAVDYTANAGAVTYRNYPVLTKKPNWVGGFDLEMERKLAELDSITGVRAYEDESGLPATKQRMRWTFTTRAEQDEFRQLAYALKGRFAGIWVPTWEDDLNIKATISEASQLIEVEWCGYTRQIGDSPGRRDIRVELIDGAVFYRRILSASELNNETERLGVDAPFGRIIEPSQIAQVSFIALARLDSDTLELSHWTGDVSESATTFKGYNNDV